MKNVLLSIIVALTAATSVYANEITNLLANDDAKGLQEALTSGAISTASEDLADYALTLAKLHHENVINAGKAVSRPNGVCIINNENQSAETQLANREIIEAAERKYSASLKVLLRAGARTDIEINGETADSVAGEWIAQVRAEVISKAKGNSGARGFDGDCHQGSQYKNGCNYR